MQVVMAHFHLNRGGVTQVIGNHLRALANPRRANSVERVVVFHGGGTETGWDDEMSELGGLAVSFHELPLLQYDAGGTAEPERLASCLLSALCENGLRAEDTVIHFHNHALGKNRSVPGAIAILARQGFALLLQIHDFAEDFRPDNYQALVQALAPRNPDELPQLLYPQSPAIHYAVLNGRDQRILRAAGVSAERLHTLPNPVVGPAQLPDRVLARRRVARHFGMGDDDRYVLYPVRGIRRKNLGELLLWGAAHPRGVRFAITLPPLNPVERPRYEAWRKLAGDLQLPVLFDVGGSGAVDYAENLAAADLAITTSVAEGFGMVFLESWLAGLPLIGRDLPEITADFASAGVDLHTLSDQMLIPIDWVGREAIAQELWESYRRALAAYHRPSPSEDDFQRHLSPLLADNLLDFARCSARLQAFVVSQVASDPSRRQQLWQLNPAIASALTVNRVTSAGLVSLNARAVRREYALESSCQRLHQVYRSVLGSPRDEPRSLPHGAAILNALLSLSRFQPIRND